MTNPGQATVTTTATTSNKRRRDLMHQDDIAGRDYYNNLKQSKLIDLVVKLQEQNLIILTRLSERSTLTATAITTTTSSNNRLNLNPVVNFTPTKSRSAASRNASEKEFASPEFRYAQSPSLENNTR